MDDREASGLLVGVGVARRFRQRRREFPDFDLESVVALAAQDIWIVMTGADDPVAAIDELLEAEEALT